MFLTNFKEFMLNRLKNIQYDPCLIFASLYLIKTLVVTVNIADAIIMLGTVGLYGYKQYLKSREPKITLNDRVQADLEKMKSDLSKIALSQMSKQVQKTQRLF